MNICFILALVNAAIALIYAAILIVNYESPPFTVLAVLLCSFAAGLVLNYS